MVLKTNRYNLLEWLKAWKFLMCNFYVRRRAEELYIVALTECRKKRKEQIDTIYIAVQETHGQNIKYINIKN